MNRGRLMRSLQVAAPVAVALGLMISGWLAWRQPGHVVAWLGLMPLCGP